MQQGWWMTDPFARTGNTKALCASVDVYRHSEETLVHVMIRQATFLLISAWIIACAASGALDCDGSH